MAPPSVLEGASVSSILSVMVVALLRYGMIEKELRIGRIALLTGSWRTIQDLETTLKIGVAQTSTFVQRNTSSV